MSSTIGLENLRQALQQVLVPSSYYGVVGAGSDATHVVDSVGGFGVNQWGDWGIQFTQDTATAALRGVWQRILSNTATTHTLEGALPAVPAVGDTYNIRLFGDMAFDLRAVGGTAQTGADWTGIFQAIRDRFPAAAALADAVANPTLTGIGTYLLGYNGATWDRLRASVANGLQVDVTRVQGTVTVDSELPAAGALADAVANPTTPTVGAALVGYNGVTWDRLRASIANGLAVDVTRVQGTVTVDSELPAAGALADALANPTTPSVGSALLGYNGATWDRLRSSLANGLAVDVTRVQGTVTVDSELPAASALADAAANPTTPAVGSALLGFNGVTWDRLRSTTAQGLQVDVTRVQGTVTVDTELPAAAALGDAAANPTVPAVGSFLHGYNGVTWDRLRATTANGLVVDVTRVQGTVTVDSELPAAAALGDATANPTAPAVGGFLHGYNGVTWDRLRTTIVNGLQVDVTRVQGTVTVDTELPAAAALGDAAANPTAPGVGACLLGYNGATWDRIRVVNTGQVQITEYTAAGTEVSARFLPIAKAAVFNLAAPGANTNILGADVTPTNSPSILRVTVLLAAGSVFKARVTNGATTFDGKFNGGTALTASCLYTFDLPWRTGDSVNYQVETNGVIQLLRAEEIGAAA